VQLPLFARIVEAPATPRESPPAGALHVEGLWLIHGCVSKFIAP